MHSIAFGSAEVRMTQEFALTYQFRGYKAYLSGARVVYRLGRLNDSFRWPQTSGHRDSPAAF